MKKIDESELQLNKFINAFKYIVLIMTFVFVGMVSNGVEVNAGDYESSNCSDQSGAKCYKDSNADYSRIRLVVDFGTNWSNMSFVLCSYSNKSGCTYSYRFPEADGDKSSRAEIIIYRDTGRLWYDLYKDGSWYSSRKDSGIDIRDQMTNDYILNGFSVKISAYNAKGTLKEWAYFNVGSKYFVQYQVGFGGNDGGYHKSFSITTAVYGSETYDGTVDNFCYYVTKPISAYDVYIDKLKLVEVQYRPGYTNPYVYTYYDLTCATTSFPTITINAQSGFSSGNVDIWYYTSTSKGRYLSGKYTVKLDIDDPTISLSYERKRAGDNTWKNEFVSSEWNTSVKVTATFADSHSGVDNSTKQYCINSSTSSSSCEWKTYSSAITITTEGTSYVHFKVKDLAGNEKISRSGTIKIDKTAPSLTVSFPNRDWINSSGISISTSSWSISDSGGSGISTRTYKWNSGTATSFVVGNKISLPSSITTGTATLTITVVDGAGNSISESKSYSVDKSSPTISFGTVNVVAGLSTNNGSSFSVQVNVTDSGGSNLNTGTVTYWWKNSNGTAKTSVQTATLSNGTFTAYLNKDSGLVSGFQKEGLYLVVTASDNAGNAVETASTVCVTLDVKAPTITFISSSNKSQSALHVVESVMMSYDNTQEVFKEVSASKIEEVVDEEVQVNEDSMVERKALVKVMNNEVIQVEHNHIPSTVSMLDYVLGSLKSCIMIGGTYLFIKQRKRVNVS